MNLTESLYHILENQGINPEQVVNTDTGERLAFEVLESAILGALDEIEENGQ